MSVPALKYARTQVALHWVTLALLLASFVSHEAMKDAWRAVLRGTEAFEPGLGTQVHVFVGLAVLGLTLLRLALRFTLGAPAPVAGQPALLARVAAVTHGLLYLVLLAIPLTGIAAWYGLIEAAGEVHEVLFTLGLGLVAAHVAAALFHQFVLKDNLLARIR